MRPAALLAPLAFALALLVPAVGRADMIATGFTYVPLELTIDHLDAFAGKEIILQGCSQPGGRSSLGFPQKDTPISCRVKFGVDVMVVTPKTSKELRDLFDKNLGWGQESMEAKRILEAAKATPCGTIQETTLVQQTDGIEKLVARYSLVAGAAGACSLSKVSSTKVLAPAPSADSAAIPAPSAPPSAAPSAAPSASAASAAPPALKSGCAGCTASRTSSSWPLAVLFVLVGLVALRRPRPGR